MRQPGANGMMLEEREARAGWAPVLDVFECLHFRAGFMLLITQQVARDRQMMVLESILTENFQSIKLFSFLCFFKKNHEHVLCFIERKASRCRHQLLLLQFALITKQYAAITYLYHQNNNTQKQAH